MIEFYPHIKLVHVAAALTSGGLFLLRGLAVQTTTGWGMATPVRYLSYSIDTVLLSAALMLLAVLPAAVFANGWLWAKLVLLVSYVGLGTFALRHGRTPQVRQVCLVAAVLAYAAMYATARTHHPLGAWTILSAWLA